MTETRVANTENPEMDEAEFVALMEDAYAGRIPEAAETSTWVDVEIAGGHPYYTKGPNT